MSEKKGFKDYIKGMPLKLIADKYEIPFETVKTWHGRNKWATQRKLKLLGHLFKLWEEGEKLATVEISLAVDIVKDCHKIYRDAKLSGGLSLEKLKEISVILCNCTTVLKRTVPEMDSALLERILNALEEDD